MTAKRIATWRHVGHTLEGSAAREGNEGILRDGTPSTHHRAGEEVAPLLPRLRGRRGASGRGRGQELTRSPSGSPSIEVPRPLASCSAMGSPELMPVGEDHHFVATVAAGPFPSPFRDLRQREPASRRGSGPSRAQRHPSCRQALLEPSQGLLEPIRGLLASIREILLLLEAVSGFRQAGLDVAQGLLACSRGAHGSRQGLLGMRQGLLAPQMGSAGAEPYWEATPSIRGGAAQHGSTFERYRGAAGQVLSAPVSARVRHSRLQSARRPWSRVTAVRVRVAWTRWRRSGWPTT